MLASRRSRSAWPAAPSLMMVLLLVSCTTLTDEAAWEGTIVERDGTTYVTNPERGLWDDGRAEPVRFVLEQVFGTDAGQDDAVLGNPAYMDIDVDASGNLYVLDGQRNRIVAFAPDGSVRWTAGGEGQGPGEIRAAFGIAVDNAGVVAIDNQERARLDLSDAGGRFLRTVPLREPPLAASAVRFAELIGFIEPGVAVLGGPLFGGFGSIGYVIDLDPPNLRARCEMNERPEQEISDSSSSGPEVREQDGMILFGSSDGYTLRAYDGDCRLLRVVSRATEYPVHPEYWEGDGVGGIASFGQVGAPLVLADGYWLGSAYWVEDIEAPVAVARQRADAFLSGRPSEPLAYHASVDLFDPAGRYLWSLVEHDGRTPSIGNPEAVGADGSVYTIADDPFPQIRRYRIEIVSGR